MVLSQLILGFGLVVSGVWGHGYLWEPAQRSTAWRRGFGTPANYNDNQLFCGGSSFQQSHGGKCGACGDPYGGPYENEAGGEYANGIITGHYNQGDVFEAEVKITAYHKGYFEFRICPNNDVTQRVSLDCLDANLLPIVGYNTNTVDHTAAAAGTTRLQLNDLGIGTGWYRVHLQLPAEMTCTQCVLQWKYKTGNSWGCEVVNGQNICGIGLGHQEHFINCADVQISATAGTSGTTDGTQSTAAPTSSPSTSSSTSSTASTTATSMTTPAPSLSPTTATTTSTPETTTTTPTTTTSASSQDCTHDNSIQCIVVPPYDTVPNMNDWCVARCLTSAAIFQSSCDVTYTATLERSYRRYMTELPIQSQYKLTAGGCRIIPHWDNSPLGQFSTL